jgi:hypothetical protein
MILSIMSGNGRLVNGVDKYIIKNGNQQIINMPKIFNKLANSIINNNNY